MRFLPTGTRSLFAAVAFAGAAVVSPAAPAAATLECPLPNVCFCDPDITLCVWFPPGHGACVSWNAGADYVCVEPI